jgi:hypothetical protein
MDRARRATATFPDLLVVAQSRPGQFHNDEIARLRRLAPLARVLALLGSWCEGETRTGKPWPASQRIYWYEWPARFCLDLDRFHGTACPSWGLPETATAEERLIGALSVSSSCRGFHIVVAGGCTHLAEALVEALQGEGFAARALPPFNLRTGPSQLGMQRVFPAHLVIWDGIQCDAAEADALRRLAAAVHPAPILALLDFPRVDGLRRAIAAGAAGVVAKPFLWDELLRRIEDCLSVGISAERCVR